MGTDDLDHVLMARVRDRDMAAYRTLVRRHLKKGIGFAERMLGNNQDAEDVMQEACFKLWKAAEHWQPRAKVSTWLYRVVFNGCIDRHRKVLPFTLVDTDTIVDDVPGTDDVLAARQRSRQVQEALRSLP